MIELSVSVIICNILNSKYCTPRTVKIAFYSLFKAPNRDLHSSPTAC